MYGGMCAFNHHNSMMKLLARCIERGVLFNWATQCNDSLVARARNILSHVFLENEGSHAFFIDADIGFDPDDILEMVETDYDVLGVPCTKRFIRWDRVQKAVRRSDRDLTDADLADAAGDPIGNYLVPEGETQKIVVATEPQEMLNMGTGILMVRRAAFLKLKKAFPDNWYEPADIATGGKKNRIWDFFPTGLNPATHEYTAENFGFCELCRKAGIKLMMCPWIKTTHAGAHLFSGNLPRMIALTGEA